MTLTELKGASQELLIQKAKEWKLSTEEAQEVFQAMMNPVRSKNSKLVILALLAMLATMPLDQKEESEG